MAMRLLNRVPCGPREQCPAGGVPTRGALPTRLNECAILNRARYIASHEGAQNSQKRIAEKPRRVVAAKERRDRKEKD